MKRILLGALGMLSGLAFTGAPTRPARRTFKNLRPVGAALRDPTEFYQSNALEAAVMKRRHRAAKLHNNTDRSLYGNPALRNGTPNLSHQEFSPLITERLNPFYVAK